jgi:hypothetical protein
MNTARWKPRATRLPVQVPLYWRSAAHREWREARTIDVSRSGVLCELTGGGPKHGEVEFLLDLSEGRHDALLQDLYCRGRVVRAREVATGFWNVAFTIDTYQQIKASAQAGQRA